MVGRVTFSIFRFIWLAALIFVYRAIQLIFYIRGDQEGLFFFCTTRATSVADGLTQTAASLTSII
jgi:hypothetical protein